MNINLERFPDLIHHEINRFQPFEFDKYINSVWEIVCFTFKDNILAVGQKAGGIDIYNIDSGKCIYTFSFVECDDDGNISSYACHMDIVGKYLITLHSEVHVLKVWDLEQFTSPFDAFKEIQIDKHYKIGLLENGLILMYDCDIYNFKVDIKDVFTDEIKYRFKVPFRINKINVDLSTETVAIRNGMEIKIYDMKTNEHIRTFDAGRMVHDMEWRHGRIFITGLFQDVIDIYEDSKPDRAIIIEHKIADKMTFHDNIAVVGTWGEHVVLCDVNTRKILQNFDLGDNKHREFSMVRTDGKYLISTCHACKDLWIAKK